MLKQHEETDMFIFFSNVFRCLDFAPFRLIIENSSQIRIRKKCARLRPINKTPASRKTGFRKIAASLTVMVLLFVMLFSISYVTLESDHDCCGEECPICECLEACGNALRLFRTGAGSVAHAAITTHAIFFVITLVLASAVIGKETPVSDKIRLNI